MAFDRASQSVATKSREALNKWFSGGFKGDDQIKQLGQHPLTGSADLFARRQASFLKISADGWTACKMKSMHIKAG